jgi:O-methyltransferase involved in polyketide biosynthesis
VTDSSPTPGQEPELPEIDTSVPHSARIWNYWLGGKDNYPADQEVGDQIAKMFPSIVAMARHDRAFLVRAVRYLAGEVGIRQFLDIGTGLPTMENTHEVAQRVAADSRIVYVDNDPLVLTHARALLTSTPEGACDYIDADLREPDRILEAAAQTLDFSQPVALMLVAILLHITDDEQAYAIVRRLVEPLAPGSYLVIVHDTADIHGEEIRTAMRFFMEQGGEPLVARSREQITRFFDGLELVEPGLVTTSRWRPEPKPSGEPEDAEEVAQYAGVARKP